MSGCLLWDFHGTLAARSWTDTTLEVLRIHEPDHRAVREDLAVGLRGGFPWHRHEEAHPELNDPARWWHAIGSLLEGAYRGIGLTEERARLLARHASVRYLDPEHYELYEDTRPALEALRAQGWRHWILSNHVPELGDIVDGLGLADLFEDVLTSATLGYEKPHPEIFQIARAHVGDGGPLWMIGDNIEADVFGAQQCDIPAILVRKSDPRAPHVAADLHAVAAFLAAQ